MPTVAAFMSASNRCCHILDATVTNGQFSARSNSNGISVKRLLSCKSGLHFLIVAAVALALFLFQATSSVLRFNQHVVLQAAQASSGESVPFPVTTVKFDFKRNRSTAEVPSVPNIYEYQFHLGTESVPVWAETQRWKENETYEFTVNQLNCSGIDLHCNNTLNLQQLLYPLEANHTHSFQNTASMQNLM